MPTVKSKLGQLDQLNEAIKAPTAHSVYCSPLSWICSVFIVFVGKPHFHMLTPFDALFQ